MTFSSRVHESLVQLVEPRQDAACGVAASRTTYLWCIRSGTPGDRLDRDAHRLQLVDERPVDLGRRRHRDRLRVVLVEDQPHGDAALHGRVERCEQRVRRRRPRGAGRRSRCRASWSRRRERPRPAGRPTSAVWPPSVRKKKSSGGTAAIARLDLGLAGLLAGLVDLRRAAAASPSRPPPRDRR